LYNRIYSKLIVEGKGQTGKTLFLIFIEYIRDVLESFSKDHLKGLERVY